MENTESRLNLDTFALSRFRVRMCNLNQIRQGNECREWHVGKHIELVGCLELQTKRQQPFGFNGPLSVCLLIFLAICLCVCVRVCVSVCVRACACVCVVLIEMGLVYSPKLSSLSQMGAQVAKAILYLLRGWISLVEVHTESHRTARICV